MINVKYKMFVVVIIKNNKFVYFHARVRSFYSYHAYTALLSIFILGTVSLAKRMNCLGSRVRTTISPDF